MSDEGKKTREGFFAVDGNVWGRVAQLGANPGAAYLVLARGTGPDNRTSSWSVNAIEKYTGLSRGRARDTLRQLQDAGFVAETRGGTFPRYDLVPASALPDGRTPPNTDRQRAVLDEVRAGRQPRAHRQGRRTDYGDFDSADALVGTGWLVKRGTGPYELAPPPDTTPAWVWLPNALVDGVAGHLSAVELVRQSADALTVRLLVDCYSGHHLAEDGGLSRHFVYQKHERVRVGQQGAYVVWGFGPGSTWVAWQGFTKPHRREPTADELKANPDANAGGDFFRRFGTLEHLGLVEWVPHLVESDATDAQPIHPAGRRYGSENSTLDDNIGQAAYFAGWAMLTPGQQQWARDNHLWLVPVPAHRENVQLVGIARLRHRPHTRVTAAWWARQKVEGTRWLDYYLKLEAQAQAREPLSPPLQHQRGNQGIFNGGSMSVQGRVGTPSRTRGDLDLDLRRGVWGEGRYRTPEDWGWPPLAEHAERHEQERADNEQGPPTPCASSAGGWLAVVSVQVLSGGCVLYRLPPWFPARRFQQRDGY